MKMANQSIHFPKNFKIGQDLRRGDRVFIAEQTGYSEDYVRKIFQGKRHNDEVIQLAEQLINMRETLTQKEEA